MRERSSSTRSAWSCASPSRPLTVLAAARTPTAARSSRTRAATRSGSAAAVSSSTSSTSGSRTWLTTTAPRPKPASESSPIASTVSCTGISSSRVTTCTTLCRSRSMPGDRLGLRVDRAHPGEVGHLHVDVEEAGDPAGGRRVEHDGVPGPGALVAAGAGGAADGLVDLADEQHVAHARGDRGREVDDAHPLQRPAGAAELVEDLQVLEQGGLGVDRDAPHLAAAGVGDQAHLLDAERGHVEGLADALAALDLGEQHPLALAGEGEREGRGHRRLADAALAGDHVQAHAVHGARERGSGHGIHPRWGRRSGPDAARPTFDGPAPVSGW